MATPASELGWVVHFALVVRFTPLAILSRFCNVQDTCIESFGINTYLSYYCHLYICHGSIT